jgi:hypothetical protein
VGDLIRFVDTITASPTVRLNLNDESVWACTNFDAPPPRLRRAIATNLLNPGGYVASASHEMRTITIRLECITNSQDLGATELQKLARELDRPKNLIQYQPTGATKPVFFRTYRSDVSDILDMVAAKTFRTITIELLADPYALGLSETLVNGVTINNDPAHVTNPMGLTLGAVLGDVPAPLRVSCTGSVNAVMPLLGVTTMQPGYTLATRPLFFQAESGTLGTDASVVSDAAMSGGSKIRVTPGTANSSVRVTFTADQFPVGNYRVFLRCGKTVNADVWTVRLQQVGWNDGWWGEDAKLTISSAAMRWADLGVLPLGSGNMDADNERLTYQILLRVWAGRTRGSGSLDIDAMILIPADGNRFLACRNIITDLGEVYTGHTIVWDGNQDAIYTHETSTGRVQSALGYPSVGGIPWVVPGHTNYLWYMVNATHYTVSNITSSFVYPADSITASVVLTATYFPRYLYVRPSAS